MKKIIYIFIALLFISSSCTKDDLEPTLEQNKDVETGIVTVEDLAGVLGGSYNRMTSNFYYGRDIIIYGEVRSDNCYANGKSGRFVTAAAMNMTDADAYASDTWTQIYAVIATSNIVISKKDAGLEGDADDVNDLVGQAYIMRALAHFDLLRIFGQQFVTGGTSPNGIPYITEYKGDNITPARNTADEVKTMIYADLDQAISLTYDVTSGSDKTYLSKYAAHALKARVANYFEDWSIAKSACEAVINSGVYSIIPSADYISSWGLKENANSIFELAYSSTDNQGINGLQYIYRGSSYGDVRVLSNLQNIFETTDVRASVIGVDPASTAYVGNLVKYPSSDYSDNIVLFRYEEVILNYAEALYELNNSDANALTQLNLITSNRGATAYTVINKANILLERRKELCFEGFRFDDLARTGVSIPLVDAFNQTHGGPAYGSYKYAFPIPKVELNANANIKQNLGY